VPARTRNHSKVDQDVARRIKLRRLELRKSQQSLAQALGVTFQQLQKYERGANRVSAGRLAKLAEALGVPVAFFFGETAVGKASGSILTGVLDNADALRLLQAFDALEDRTLRRALLGLAEAMVAHQRVRVP
jgi:transcriptional regulator with XRE-family HTH domain